MLRRDLRIIRPPSIEWEPFKARAPSCTVIAHYALNGQMHSTAHTGLTAPLVLHHTRIYKRTMKKIIFNGQRWNKYFFIAIYHSSLVKGAMNAAHLCKLSNGVKKTIFRYHIPFKRTRLSDSHMIWLLPQPEMGKNTTSYLRFRSSISTQQVAYLIYTFFQGKIEGQCLLPSIFCRVGVDGAMFLTLTA